VALLPQTMMEQPKQQKLLANSLVPPAGAGLNASLWLFNAYQFLRR